MTCVGIDPGLHGAIAVIPEAGQPWAIPFGEDAYRAQLAALQGRPVAVCLEHVSSMPGQGVASTFKFGTNFGYIQGLLSAFQLPYELVRPQKWKREFSVTADKNSSIAVCRRLFPGVSLLAAPRARTDHDGIAEALLMAEYARRRMTGSGGG